MPKTKRSRKLGARSRRQPVVHRTQTTSSVDPPAAREERQPSPGETSTKNTNSSSVLLSTIENDGEAMQLARDFRTLCSRHADPTYAKSIQQYMRNQFVFFGLKAPLRRRLQKQFTSEHRERLTRHSFLLQFTVCLWRQEERECQLYGVDLMSEFREEVLGKTETEWEDAVACAEALITTKSWWDTVDLLASQMVGHLVRERPERGVPLMEEWTGHPCMWLRRTALLHQLNYKTDTDKDRLFKFCASVAQEEEFFIRKAIGWALRQYGKTDGDSVREFVEKHRDTLSKLSIREALKHL